MSKQSFTTGQVLTAAQVNTLQANDFNQTVSVKTANYTLAAADKGTRIEFNTSGSVTCTVNSGLFDAGDTLVIQNRGSGVVTVTAGTATVNTSATLALSQYDAGTLYFISDSASIFFNTDAGGGSPLTTKGDLYGFSTVDARIPIGADSTVLTADSSQSLGLKWATPASGATTWTLRKNADGKTIRTIAYNGSNLYVAAGATGVLFTSSDGLTWTSRTSGFGSSQIQRVIFANSIWVAVGESGIITTSTDGTTWTARTSNMSTNEIFDVNFGNGYFVAVGDGGGSTNTGGVTYSTDGITWTRKSMTPAVGTTYRSVVYNGTNWNVVGNNSTNNSLTIATNPTGTWTAISQGATTDVLGAILWDGTRLITFTSSTVYYAAGNDVGGSIQYNNLVTQRSSLQKNTAQIYNSKLHQINGAYQIANTNVTTSGYMHGYEGTPQISPNNNSILKGGTAGTDTQSAIFVGSAGVITGDSNGSIWTSF